MTAPDTGGRPPRLAFILVNWNYGRYVGATIRSIRGQTFTDFTCIIVDNGSTDDSVQAIGTAIAGDPRFVLHRLPENLGQLGAVVATLPHVDADYLCVVDADDYLLPDFAAAHLQVHLTLDPPVGVTSSNLLEIGGDGTLQSGGLAAFMRSSAVPATLDPDVTRMAGLGEDAFRTLSGAVARIARTERGWLWSPGTANVFRRAALDLIPTVCPVPVPIPYCADTSLNTIAHIHSGTALIDMPLTAYRIHGGNLAAASVSLEGIASQRPDTGRRSFDQRVDMAAALVERFAITLPKLGATRFWDAVDLLLRPSHHRVPDSYDDDRLTQALRHALPTMLASQGIRPILSSLPPTMPTRVLLRAAASGWRRIGIDGMIVLGIQSLRRRRVYGRHA